MQKWMISPTWSIQFLLVFFSLPLHAQWTSPIPAHRFYSHVATLADDSMQGRLTGSHYERMAGEYIQSHLLAAGCSTYFWTFPFTEKVVEAKPGTPVLKINEQPVEAYALSGTGVGTIKGRAVNVGYGIFDAAANHNDYANKANLEGKIFLIDAGLPPPIHPHHPLIGYRNLQRRIRMAEENGAAAVVFYLNDTTQEVPSRSISPRTKKGSIPVVFTSLPGAKAMESMLEIHVDLLWNEGEARNVVGWMDKGASQTLVLGAHYDHIGLGHFGSRSPGSHDIHNGADDNASGTAMLIELAYALAKDQAGRFNYLFLAFSGEEMGLLGSRAYTESDELQGFRPVAMLNFDMVGRLDSTKKILSVNGIGTSPVFKEVTDSLKHARLTIQTSESGVGPSDHASFYAKGIPALHFFTGLHSEYHKPDDDVQTLHFEGMEWVSDYTLNFISALQSRTHFPFTKTAEPTQKRTDMRVSLGVVPDYNFNGKGLKISGTTKGKPAERAGLIDGDVIIKVDQYEIQDIHAYMNILSRYKSGDTSTIYWIRGKKKMKKTLVW
jgi:aminopeptidase YwaD